MSVVRKSSGDETGTRKYDLFVAYVGYPICGKGEVSIDLNVAGNRNLAGTRCSVGIGKVKISKNGI